jgi:hypothetical protein
LEVSEEGVAGFDAGGAAEASGGDGVGDVTPLDVTIKAPLSL